MADTELVEIELPDGDVVLAHIEFLDSDVAVVDRLKLAAIARSAGKIAHWAKESTIAAMPEPPNRLSVQVGLTLAAQAGHIVSVIAGGSAQASLTVVVEWDLKAKE